MAIAYQYDTEGYFAGTMEDYGLLPNNATNIPAELQSGFIPRWNGTGWEQVEDHKGKEGYLDGKPHTIKEYGALPEGWTKEQPALTKQEQHTARIASIQAQLTDIDAASARPMRALLAGTASSKEKERLAVLEAQSAGLRQELAGLQAAEGL